MFRLLLVSGLAAVALSQCPQRPSQQCCSDEDNTTCLSVNTIDLPLSVLAAQQPLYYTFMPNTRENDQLDNVCLTLFPLPNGTETYIIYNAHVYCDGSLRITSYIAKNNGIGESVWANPDRTYTNYILGDAKCGTYVGYRCGDCGDIDRTPFVFGLSPTLNSTESKQCQLQTLTVACQQKAYAIAKGQGLSADNLYVLPNKRPSQCVYQQPCQPKDSPVYCEEQGSCQTY